MTMTFRDAIKGPWTTILGTGTEYWMREEGDILHVGIQGMDPKSPRDWVASGAPGLWIIGGVVVNLGVLFKWHEFLGGSDFLERADGAMTVVFHCFSQGASTAIVGVAWMKKHRPDLWEKTYVVAWGQHRAVWATKRRMQSVFRRVDAYHVKGDPVTVWGWPMKLAGHKHVYKTNVPWWTRHDLELYGAIPWDALA